MGMEQLFSSEALQIVNCADCKEGIKNKSIKANRRRTKNEEAVLIGPFEDASWVS